jgi:transposase
VVTQKAEHQTASRWHRAWTERGPDGLAGAGRRRKLTGKQLAEVEAALETEPKANGFDIPTPW